MLARLLCALLFIAPALAQNQLKMVVILTRHGVRSPLSPMSNHAKDSWPLNQPDWGVDCCGDLTPSGEQLVRLMGAYYRDYYGNKDCCRLDAPTNRSTSGPTTKSARFKPAGSLHKGWPTVRPVAAFPCNRSLTTLPAAVHRRMTLHASGEKLVPTTHCSIFLPLPTPTRSCRRSPMTSTAATPR